MRANRDHTRVKLHPLCPFDFDYLQTHPLFLFWIPLADTYFLFIGKKTKFSTHCFFHSHTQRTTKQIHFLTFSVSFAFFLVSLTVIAGTLIWSAGTWIHRLGSIDSVSVPFLFLFSAVKLRSHSDFCVEGSRWLHDWGIGEITQGWISSPDGGR